MKYQIDDDVPNYLANSKRGLETLIDNLPGMAYRCENNPERTMQFVSNGCRRLTGYDPKDLLGEGVVSYSEIIHPDDRGMAWEQVQKALGSKMPFQLEYRIRTADGEDKWVWEQGRGVFGTNGELEVIEGFITDITKRKRIEEREEFLYSLLRHDLINKLQVIKGYLEMIVDNDPEKWKRYIEAIKRPTLESLNLLDKYGKLREVELVRDLEVMNLSTVIRGVVHDWERTAMEKGISIEYHLQDEEIMAGPFIKELFSNLVENSIRHSGATIIKISSRREGAHILCQIEDDGRGISEEDRPFVFDRGFRRGSNAGSGLGAYLAYRIACNYGGRIDVGDSELGGAKFIVTLAGP